MEREKREPGGVVEEKGIERYALRLQGVDTGWGKRAMGGGSKTKRNVREGTKKEGGE